MRSCEKYKELLWPMVIQPVFDRVADPTERIFGILDGYRRQLLASKYQSGCPIGNLALELANSIPAARAEVAANFTGWRKAIEQCLSDAAGRLPASVDKEQLALFVLTTMEGAVMLAPAIRTSSPTTPPSRSSRLLRPLAPRRQPLVVAAPPTR